MKKLLGLVATSALIMATAANAQYAEDTSAMEIMTIEQVKNQPDDARVKVKGNLSKKVGSDKYELTENGQMILVEIDEEDFKGQKVTAEDIVVITGEIDKDMFKPTEIDAEYIEIITPANPATAPAAAAPASK